MHPVLVHNHNGQDTKIAQAAPQWYGWSSISHLFVFGDSLSAASFDFKGLQPTRDNPFGNPSFPRGRPNGGVTPDFLTMNYNDSFIQTYNLAYGGATVDNDVFHSVYGAPSFRQQLENMFKPTYTLPDTPNELRWDPDTTLFMIRFGINDVTIDYLRDDMHLVVSEPITSYFYLAQDLYHLGARNFLFLNLGPVDRNFGRNGGNVENVQRLTDNIAEFNKGIAEVKQNLTQMYSDLTAFIFDVHTFLPWLAEDPMRLEASQGLRNTSDICLEYAWGLAGPTPASSKFSFEQSSVGCGVPLEQYFWVSTKFIPRV